jgi:AraC-like DNA-binding protein
MGPVSVIPLDDRALLTTYQVDPRLAEHVQSFWTLRVEAPPARLRVIPDGHVDLVFDVLEGKAYLAGPRDTPLEVVHERPTELFGVTLMPGAATATLGISAAALSLDWSPLESVVGPWASVLGQRLRAASTPLLRLGVIEAFLLGRLSRLDPRVTRALCAIVDAKGQVGVAALGHDARSSSRNLTRLFHEWVGLSPKRFARIVRVQAALRRLAEHPPPDLARLASELGFADQAHMTRELRALAGAAPRSLAETFKRKADSFKV